MSHHHTHGSARHPQQADRNQQSHQPVHSNRRNRGHFPTAQRAGDKISYNVLRCRPVITQSSPQVQHDHLQVLLEIDSGTRYWMTINIRSGQDQVHYFLTEDFQHPITQRLLDAQLPSGFSALDKQSNGQPNTLALDYIRSELVDFNKMDKLDPANVAPPDSTGIADMLTTLLVNVMRAPDARLFIFGSRFDDGAKYSSYDLATGIHDIHMNQGSVAPHKDSNGVYQDGALLAYYPSEKRWSAVFLKFASQATTTDSTGNPKT